MPRSPLASSRVGSLPTRERGSKLIVDDFAKAHGMSLPARERGSKLIDDDFAKAHGMSLPARERGLVFPGFGREPIRV